MTDAVETMAWTGETPWHGLGNKVSNNLTPAQMLKAASLNWGVEKRKLFYPSSNGKTSVEVPGKFALVRTSDDKHLTITGATYKPVQNATAAEFFQKFVVAGHMKMETMGSLHGGQYIWALARLGVDFKLGKEDEVRGFLLLCNPHVFGKSMVVQFTPIRVVCWNTLTFALGSSLMGKGGGTFRMPHSIEFNDKVKAQAEEALGLAKGQMAQFKEAAQLLSKKKATASAVEEYFCEVLKFDPKAAQKKKGKKKGQEGDAIEPRMLPKLRLALTHAPGAALNTAQGTWWGAVNAVTFVVDHELGRDQSASLRTAWLGTKANLKRRAIKIAIDRVS
jgi:phage/plasmid-like protein (TIGR03299 family)